MGHWLQRVFRSGKSENRSSRARRKTHVSSFAKNRAAEILETRVLLDASREIGGLRFFTQGDFTDNGTISTTDSPVEVGLMPIDGGAFKPLLKLTGGVDLDSLDTAQSFVSKGSISAITGTASQVLATGLNSFSIADLISTGAPITTGLQAVDVAKEKFLAKSIKLALPEGSEDATESVLQMAGDLNFPAIATGFSLDGLTNVVTAGIAGKDVLVAAINGDLPLRDSFTVGNLTFSKASLGAVKYDLTTDTLTIQGSSSFNFRNNTIDVSIGSPGNPGLTIQDGNLTAFNFSVTSEFKIAKGTIKTTSLTADYDAAASTYKITGEAAVALGNNTLQANFGDNGTAGIVITNGSLAQLGFTTSSVVEAGGLSIKTSGVTANYVDSTDTFTLTGDASFALQNNTVNIGLGADSTSGLKIVAGSVTDVGATITSDLKIGGLSFKSTNLRTQFTAATSTLAIAGATSFEARGTTFTAQFGSTIANGGVVSDVLVIQNGSLKSLDAAVTGSFTTAKVKFTAKSIRLNYRSDAGNTRFELSGGASMEFNAGSVKSVADVLFGVNGGRARNRLCQRHISDDDAGSERQSHGGGHDLRRKQAGHQL